MIIKKLTIKNFRSYYGVKEFEFDDHLNLILGSNGDGKTTFFEALNWVLTPEYAKKNKDDAIPEASTLVSAKMFKELKNGETGEVSVMIEIKGSSGQRFVERRFDARKTEDGDIWPENRSHKAWRVINSMKREMPVQDVFEKQSYFPSVIKKYHVFKGEDKLNIFKDTTTLGNLIDMFSDVKDVEPYKSFAKYAEQTAQRAIAGSKEKEDKAMAKLLGIRKDISSLNSNIAKTEEDMDKAKGSYNEAKKQIEAIESDYDIIKKAAKLKDEIAKDNSEIERLSYKIDEDYSIKLLDEQWILMGFAPILAEYNRKMDSFSASKNNIEDDYRKKQEEEINKERVERVKTNLDKVVWNKSDIDKMKHSMYAHRCVYCGNEAPEGTVTYDFLKQRINDVIELLTPRPEEKRQEIKKMFPLHNVEEMQQLGKSLSLAGKDLKGIRPEIDSFAQGNAEYREKLSNLTKNVDKKQKEVNKLYATSSTGENLEEYVSNISIVNRWHQEKGDAALSYNKLKKRLAELKTELASKKKDETKNAKNTTNGGIFLIHNFFSYLSIAFENTGESIYTDFLNKLAKEANVFLARLNVDDFTGVIKISLDKYNNPIIELQDKNGQLITNPNTSLLTTMHISILFAISELTKEVRDEDYPLIFDAPTSSFDEGKDKTFYECLQSQVDKQCIVVTKSYLYKNDEGEFVLDEDALDRLNCKKFRITKLTGFDKLDITTIDTQVDEIN